MTRKRKSEFFKRNRLLFKAIAKDRIRQLLVMAEDRLHSNPNLAREYVSIAIRIGMKCKVRLPTGWRWRICSHCNTLLRPGFNCVTRIRSTRQPHIIVRCLNCGRISRKILRQKTPPRSLVAKTHSADL